MYRPKVSIWDKGLHSGRLLDKLQRLVANTLAYYSGDKKFLIWPEKIGQSNEEVGTLSVSQEAEAYCAKALGPILHNFLQP